MAVFPVHNKPSYPQEALRLFLFTGKTQKLDKFFFTYPQNDKKIENK